MPKAFYLPAIRPIPHLRYLAKPVYQPCGLLYSLQASQPSRPLLRERTTTSHRNRLAQLPPTTSISTSYTDLPIRVKDWIMEHPFQTMFQIVNGVVLITPAAATSPIFHMIGLTALGPEAGMYSHPQFTSPEHIYVTSYFSGQC